jgi:heme/copper-type cytochrome/quinol oxidase subunit 4
VDVAGIGFAAFVVICVIPLAVALYRGNIDPTSRFYGVVFVVSAVVLAIVKIIMYSGLMDGEGATYWTLNYSLSALAFTMLIMLMLSVRKRSRSERSD